jgi:hypothetical protein
MDGLLSFAQSAFLAPRLLKKVRMHGGTPQAE